MDFDPATIGIVSVILAAISVVATLFAPRLVGTSRIDFVVTSVQRIRRRTPTSGLAIEVLHNGIALADEVFIVDADIVNTGARDIARDQFIDPVEIVAASDFDLLSLEVANDTKAKPLLSFVTHHVFTELEHSQAARENCAKGVGRLQKTRCKRGCGSKNAPSAIATPRCESR